MLKCPRAKHWLVTSCSGSDLWTPWEQEKTGVFLQGSISCWGVTLNRFMTGELEFDWWSVLHNRGLAEGGLCSPTGLEKVNFVLPKNTSQGFSWLLVSRKNSSLNHVRNYMHPLLITLKAVCLQEALPNVCKHPQMSNECLFAVGMPWGWRTSPAIQPPSVRRNWPCCGTTLFHCACVLVRNKAGAGFKATRDHHGIKQS